MRIIYDYQTFSILQYGGISRYFVELASHMSRRPGAQVQVVSPLLCSRFLSERRGSLNVTGIDLSNGPRLPLRIVQGVNGTLFQAYAAVARPDIVHETYYAPRRMAPRSAQIVTTIHDTIPERLPEFFPNSDVHRARIRQALLRADHVICVSESTRRDLLELYDVRPEHVSVVRLGSSIVASQDEPMNIGMPYFLHVGARYPYKNFGALLRAFGLARLYRTHKLVAFSAHPFTAAEFESIDELGIPRASIVAVSGEDHLLARYYAGAEALVFPSLYEGFGIPLVEAMCCGCPIIASKTSSLPEVGGNAALYCDPKEPGAFAEAMQQVASSPEMRADMTAKGRERARLFSWEKCATETYAIYKELLRS